MMNRINEVENYLDYLIPEPKCELNYNKDYELLIAIMLSAQTTDKRVNKVTEVLFNKYDSLEKLKDADVNDIRDIIKSIGTFNKKANFVKEISTILCDKYNKELPLDRKELESLPGVGRKTVNVLLGELYNYPLFAVDTHVDRVSKRLGLVKDKDDVLEIEKKLSKKFKKDELAKRHKQMVLFGRYYCTSKKPSCINCKLKDICKYKDK